MLHSFTFALRAMWTPFSYQTCITLSFAGFFCVFFHFAFWFIYIIFEEVFFLFIFCVRNFQQQKQYKVGQLMLYNFFLIHFCLVCARLFFFSCKVFFLFFFYFHEIRKVITFSTSTHMRLIKFCDLKKKVLKWTINCPHSAIPAYLLYCRRKL